MSTWDTSAAVDSFISSSNIGSNYGDYTSLFYVGYLSSKFYPVFNWNLPPAGNTVTDGTIMLTLPYATGSSHYAYWHIMKDRGWGEFQVTWAYLCGGVIDSAGWFYSDFNATISDATFEYAPAGSYAYYLNSTAIAKLNDCINGGSSFKGFTLNRYNSKIPGWTVQGESVTKIASVQYPNPSYWPRLILNLSDYTSTGYSMGSYVIPLKD